MPNGPLDARLGAINVGDAPLMDGLLAQLHARRPRGSEPSVLAALADHPVTLLPGRDAVLVDLRVGPVPAAAVREGFEVVLRGAAELLSPAGSRERGDDGLARRLM